MDKVFVSFTISTEKKIIVYFVGGLLLLAGSHQGIFLDVLIVIEIVLVRVTIMICMQTLVFGTTDSYSLGD